MQDAEASRSKICLLLKNEKQNTFVSKNNLEFTRVLEFTRRKGSGIHQRNNRQKSEFLLISIILKNILQIRRPIKGSVKLNDQKNIF